MAQGDFLDPNAWNLTTPTIGTATHTAAPAHGDVGDVMAAPTDPDTMGGLTAWIVTAPTLGVGTVAAPAPGKGDVTDPWAWEDYNATFYLTSQIYPVLVLEHMQSAGNVVYQPAYQETEHITGAGALTAGTLTLGLMSYTYWPAEHVSSGPGALLSGTLALGLITYTYWPAEHISSGPGQLLSGTLAPGLITYTYWPAEHLQSSGTFSGGTLT